MKICEIDGCGRKHAAHGLCLMHYKRVQRHGTTDYKWGGREVGRPCSYCDRPAIAREMCFRHYQMDRKHGDPLYSDKKKIDERDNGTHSRRGYKMVTPVASHRKAEPAGPSVEKSHRFAEGLKAASHGFRDGSQRTRRQWEHRKIAGAKPGEIVHHIDGDKLNNDPSNLHVFRTAKEHGAAHRSLELLAYEMLRRGLVEFDPVTGLYRPTESFPPARSCNSQP